MNNIIDEIRQGNNIVLLCHNNPDGDAIGSTLAMYNMLQKLGKKVDIVIADAPEKFNFIHGYAEIKENSDNTYELAIILDTATIERLNNPNNIIERIDRKVVIDHHANNTYYGDENYVDIAPACCELVYRLIKEMNIEIDENIATPLCAGLLSDTGGLSHLDVKPSSYQMAADLSNIVHIPSIHKRVLGTITRGQFELQKKILENIEFYKDGQIVFFYIDESDLEKYNVARSEVDMLANIGRNIEGVEVVIFIRNYIEVRRASLRSNNVAVNEVAKVFGGGGHKNAVGITIDMEFNELKEKLIKEVGKKIDEWNTSGK